jgi:uncharacterized protein (TIGR02996 family)
MTRDDFLRAVLAAPDDDSPRLAYADWLDEHCEPDRAAFIRVQCRLARLGHKPAGCENAGCPCRELAGRERELIELDRALGLTDPGRLAPDAGLRFRRGFLEALTVTEFGWQKGMAMVCREHPLRELTLDLGPLPTDTGNVVHVDVRLPAVHVLDRIAVQTEGRPLAIFDPSHPAKYLTARRGPFQGRRLALVTAVWLPPGYYPA